ncbi:MAG: transposase [Candidatus Liptonbacteria bacterium]|nr:transposase [Candidatus Liptonbacteria bacterium]
MICVVIKPGPLPRPAPAWAISRFALGFSGFDGAKKVNGRKRHIVTDTLGLLLHIVVHDASIPDRVAAERVLGETAKLFSRLKTIFADQGYAGKLILLVKYSFSLTISIIKRNEARIFKVLPRRWVVERTFRWFGFYRRLTKDHERYPTHSEALCILPCQTSCCTVWRGVFEHALAKQVLNLAQIA